MADTRNTGTMLIEEGGLLPESLRFQSEPWTSFYMAGEMIREVRKASGKQSESGSDPRDGGSLAKDDPNGGAGLLGAPECGDAMKLQVKINSETPVITEAEFKTFGCGSAIASSPLATEQVKGKTSRKRWPSRTRISSPSSAFPGATLFGATRYSRIGGRLHLVGSPIF